jgi:hypothetical protein
MTTGGLTMTTETQDIKVIHECPYWRAVEMPPGSFGWTEGPTFTIQYLNHEDEWVTAAGYHGMHHAEARQDAIDAAIQENERRGRMPAPPPRMFTWTLEVQVAECWVEDGFDFNESHVRWLKENLIDYAYSNEVEVRVVKAPNPRAIRIAQGYQDDGEATS